MDISELKQHSEYIFENKSQLLDSWMSYDIVRKTLEKYISIDEFQSQYASLVFKYYFDVINGIQEIGKCPVMENFLNYFSEKNVPVHEIFIICSHMRIVLIHFAFKNNFASEEIITQIGYVSDRNLTGVMGRYEDIIISKTKQVEEYATFLEQYKAAIDTSSIVSKTDTRGIITFVNDNFCEISGYSREELVGQPHNIVRHKDMSSEKFKELWDVIQSKKPWSSIVVNRSKDGKEYFVNTIIFPILDTENEIIEYMSIRHDLTELFHLNLEIEETQKEIIYKMGEIGETRSRETGFHVKRVAEYSKILAKHIKLSDDETKLLFMASPMHDIGKVGIPDSILLKAGKLTPDEWEVMKTHAQIGYNILNTCERPMIKAAAIVSQQHHEHWDGNGYPQGLKGNDIHIYGRITAVADVFDALGSDRVYKKAWPLEKVLKYLVDEKGKKFDPELVDILLENIDEFLEIREQFSETDVCIS